VTDDRPGRLLDLNALSGRYLLVTLALAVVVTLTVGWAGWVLDQATNSSTNSLEARNRIQQLSSAIRSSVWQSNFALQAYMISPADDTRQRVLQTIRNAEQKAIELEEVQLEALASEGNAEQLDGKLGTLYLQLDRLMEIRSKPEQLHPAMELMSNVMLPTNDAFITAVNAAVSELSNDNLNLMIAQEYRLLDQIRDRWRQMISAYRVMVANRFGAFSEGQAGFDNQSHNVNLFYEQIQQDLDRLTALDDSGELSFQTAYALEEMRLQTERWYTYFQKVKGMYATENWRTDLPFLRDVVQPLFNDVWQSLLAIEAAIEHRSNQQVAHLSTAGTRMGMTLWVLAGLLFTLLVVGYAVLDRMLLAPIARISRALASDVDIKSDHPADVPIAGTREIQQLVAAFETMRSDVQQRRLALEYQSLHDSLTGLPNRACLLAELHEAVDAAKETNKRVGLMIMDLDHFKEINDTLGHPVGDMILQEVAKRLTATIGKHGLTARLGGDEFAVILPTADQRRCNDTASSIAGALEREFQVGGHKLYVGGSVGVAIYPDHGIEVSVLMRHADVAMYLAKHTGKHTAFYDDSQDENSVLRLQLVKELKDAINNDHLELYYQPKLDLNHEAITSVEALLRWDHPEHGMVPPDRIIPMAEQTGVIHKLTQWVLEKALQQQAYWREAGTDINVAVNLSAYDLRDASLPDTVDDALAATATPPEKLTLEITESAMMADLSNATVLLSRIKEMGVGIAIDDFGTGFSSLSYLKKLPVRELKIDKSFVINMNHDENDAMIVHSTIDLAHNLGLSVVAEGVENQEILERLHAQGCDLIQGYHLCRPLPPEKLEKWLRDQPRTITGLREVGSVA
jgi:diguanylate cyclase (GGDEF)-like protein